MADITLSYKGSTIAEVSASGTTKLNTKGKYCEDDITLQYVKPAAYIKLAETEVEVNTTSTSSISIDSLTVDTASDLWTSANMIYITVRDKAGKRSGYFLESVNIFLNPYPASGSPQTAATQALRTTVAYNNQNEYTSSSGSAGYGVYVYDINNNGRVRIYARYNDTISLTINGTYKVEVYALVYPSGTPFA